MLKNTPRKRPKKSWKRACMKLERAVGKIVKLEIFKLESSFYVLLYTREIVKLKGNFFATQSFPTSRSFQLPFPTTHEPSLIVDCGLSTAYSGLFAEVWIIWEMAINKSEQDLSIFIKIKVYVARCRGGQTASSCCTHQFDRDFWFVVVEWTIKYSLNPI